MPVTLKVAIIGCGTIGSTHAQKFALCPRTQLEWCVDSSLSRAQRLADTFGIPHASGDFRDALQDPNVDAVIVCVPNYLHSAVTIDALQAGKHVFCEKPIALNMEQAEQMRATARHAGRILAIGVVNRFNDYVNLLKQSILEDELGEIYHVSLVFKAYRSIPGLGSWFTTRQKAGGGVMIDWGFHFIDLALYCTGFPSPRSISGVAHSRLARNLEDYAYLSMWAGPPHVGGTYDVEEYASGLIRTSGPSIAFEGAWAQNVDAPAMLVDFLGEKGGIRLSYGQGFIHYGFKDGTLFEKKPQRNQGDMFLNQAASFADACLDGPESPARIDSVIESQRIIDGFYRSAESGREIEL